MPPGFNLMLNLNKTGNFMQKSAIIVLYLKKNYTQLFFVLENFGAFKKNYTQQHSWNYPCAELNGSTTTTREVATWKDGRSREQTAKKGRTQRRSGKKARITADN